MKGKKSKPIPKGLSQETTGNGTVLLWNGVPVYKFMPSQEGIATVSWPDGVSEDLRVIWDIDYHTGDWDDAWFHQFRLCIDIHGEEFFMDIDEDKYHLITNLIPIPSQMIG